MTVKQYVECVEAYRNRTSFSDGKITYHRYNGVYYSEQEFKEAFRHPSTVLKISEEKYQNPDSTKDFLYA